jgi:polysaccharide chain length determinant protein (PEP-CTERM system associated)
MNIEGGIQLSDLSGMVRRRGQVAFFIALAIALVAFWISMALPNMYRSYATVLVEPQSVTETLVRAGVRDSDLNERLHLMTARILSRPRLSKIIDDYSLYQDESEYMLREELIDLLRRRIRVQPVVPDLEQERDRASRRSVELVINEFKIFFSDENAVVARNVAQRLANDFIESHIEARVETSQKSLEFVEDELQRLAERIEVVEGEIARVKGENPGKRPEDVAANQRRIERVFADLAAAQRDLATATSDEAFYRSQLATARAIHSPNDDASPGRRIEILKLQLNEVRSRGYTAKHPDVVRLESEIAALEETIRRGAEGADGAPPTMIQQQIEAEVRRAALRKASSEQEVARLRDLAEQIERLLLETPAVVEQLDALEREYRHLFESFQDFSNRQLEASVQAQLERRQLGEQFRVLEAAFVAPQPSAPNRPLIILLGVFLGVAVGGGLAVLLEALDSSAHDSRQLQVRFQLPVLAAIPEISLESDRVALRKRRLRTAIATFGVVGFVLVGSSLNYVWVNGLPGPLRSLVADEAEGEGEGEGAARPEIVLDEG